MEKGSIYNKRASTSISILLLVMLTLVLTISALIIFYINSGKINSRIGESITELDKLLLKEHLLNFYIENAVEESAFLKEKDNNARKKEFINNLIKQFENYKIDEKYVLEDLDKIIPQIAESNVVIDSAKGTIGISLAIWITESRDKDIYMEYAYKKVFESKINLMDNLLA